ncbi:MAG: hypothetical protein LAO03_00695 [Acidobacteriia bacterium]|nr:hypothetical protein [Terriglobia bacterium]
MIFSITLVVASLVALALLLRAARGRGLLPVSPDDLARRIRPVDIEAFRNLIDPSEEQFLRAHLSRRAFRSVQRQRLLATLDYVRGASHNAAILLRLGEAARRDLDPRIAEAGQRLVDNAVRLRMFALFSMAQLCIGIALPGAHISAGRMVESYQQLSGLASQLAVMQRPQPSSPLVAAS